MKPNTRQKETQKMAVVKTSIAFEQSLWKEGKKLAIDEERDFQDLVNDALRDYLRKKGGAK